LERVERVDAGGWKTTVSFDYDSTKEWSFQKAQIAPDGQQIGKVEVGDNGAVNSATYYGAELAGNIGALFGSQLGTYLGSNSLTKLATGTVIGTIGKEIGAALYYGGTYTLDVAVKNAFGTLGNGTGIGSLPAGAIGAASSLLMAELAQSLHLSGWEGWAFTTTGTSITTQLVTNA
jgi:hypothetical protein